MSLVGHLIASRGLMSKRIVVCSAQIPFDRGGAEILVESLRDELIQRGHQAEIVSLPYKWYPSSQVVKSCLAWRLMDLTESNGQPIDLVICTKFPSYIVNHPNKVVWLVHQFRHAYDLAGTRYDGLSGDPAAPQYRALIHRIDNQALREARRVFTISENVRQRLSQYNRLDADPLYPPPALQELFRCNIYGDFIFTVSRLDKRKRIDWLLRGMAHTQTPVRCIVAGAGRERVALERLATQLGLRDKVRFLGRVSDDEVLDLYADCLAVYFAPYDEDYGYVTVEAFRSRKPVLTGNDSGGVLEFVTDGKTGFVLPPDDARQLAERIDRLYQDRELARTLGESGLARVEPITWDSAIASLVGDKTGK